MVRKLQHRENGNPWHQERWLSAELHNRGWHHMKGSDTPPEIDESKWPSVSKVTTEYESVLQQCQSEIGSLQWVSQGSRPDIAAITGTLDSLMTINRAHVGFVRVRNIS